MTYLRNGGHVRHLYPGKRVDARGSFTELWRLTDGPILRQVNLSVSRPGVLRGMHYHREQSDLWTAVEGEAEVHLVHLTGSLTHETFLFHPGDQLLIGPSVAHGFLALGRRPFILLYGVTVEYDASDEFGYRWDDEHNGPWLLGGKSPILSERDRRAPSLQDVLGDLYRARPVG